MENDDGQSCVNGIQHAAAGPFRFLKTEAPIVATGIEYKAAVDSGAVVLAKGAGTVTRVDADEIIIRYDEMGELRHHLIKFYAFQPGVTCINQRPIVAVGDRVQKDDAIADGPSTSEGEISLGKNVLIGFMTWEGYNYEDAVLLNERLVKDDVYTSIHIEEYETESRDTKLGTGGYHARHSKCRRRCLKRLGRARDYPHWRGGSAPAIFWSGRLLRKVRPS